MRTALIAALGSFVTFAACTSTPAPTAPSAVSPVPLAQRPDAGVRVVDFASFAFTRDTAPAQVPDAPAAPSNLTFDVNGTTVSLSWRAPGAGPAPTSYLVEAGTASGASDLARFNTGSTATTLTVTGVPEATYVVRVRAVNADGPGSASNEVTIVIGTGTPPGPGPGPGPNPNPNPCNPLAPSGLIGSASGNTITLLWTGVGGGALSYVIEVGTTSGAADIGQLDTGSTATSFTGPAPAGRFYIRMRTRAACGIGQSASNEVVVTVTGGPSTPTATGRWVGVSPEGMVADLGQMGCPRMELDLDMTLTVAGTTLRGSATTHVRAVPGPSFCNGNAGSTATYTVTGTAGADGSVAMQFGTGNPVYSLTGSVTATRMTGRWTDIHGGAGAFTVNRQ